MKSRQLLELKPRIVISGSKRTTGVEVPSVAGMSTVGVNFRAGNTQMDFDRIFVNRALRGRPAFQGDMAVANSVMSRL